MIRELDGLWIEIIVMATSKAGSNRGLLPESLIPGLSGGFAHTPMGKKKKGRCLFSWNWNFIIKQMNCHIAFPSVLLIHIITYHNATTHSLHPTRLTDYQQFQLLKLIQHDNIKKPAIRTFLDCISNQLCWSKDMPCNLAITIHSMKGDGIHLVWHRYVHQLEDYGR